MRLKNVLENLIFLGVFFIVSPVFSTSGACSSHNGVNCGTGPDWDGSVICFDGWTESSVAYTSSDECQNYLTCSNAEYDSLKEKYEIDSMKSEYQSLVNEINSIKAQLQVDLANVESKPITMNSIIGQQNRLISDANFKTEPLISRANNLQTTINFNISRLNRECDELGRELIQNIMNTRLQQKLNAEKAQETSRQLQILQEEERIAKEQAEIARQNPVKTPVISTTTTPAKQPIKVTPVKIVKKPVISPVVSSTSQETSTIQTTSSEKTAKLNQIFKEQKVSKVKQFFNFLLNFFR